MYFSRSCSRKRETLGDRSSIFNCLGSGVKTCRLRGEYVERSALSLSRKPERNRRTYREWMYGVSSEDNLQTNSSLINAVISRRTDHKLTFPPFDIHRASTVSSTIVQLSAFGNFLIQALSAGSHSAISSRIIEIGVDFEELRVEVEATSGCVKV